MRVYILLEAKWAVEAIRKRRLKVCRLFDLNDPFELFAFDQKTPDLRRRARSWAAELNDVCGVLCFTTNWGNPLMWSHYGDRHRGVCLGFDAYDSILTPVTYKVRRLPSKKWLLNGPGQPDHLKHALLTTKFVHWKYEEERRELFRLADLSNEGELYFRPFDERLKLTEVIAGPRCCVKWKRQIVEAARDCGQKTRLIKARLSFKKFEVVPQKLEGSVSRGFQSNLYWRDCSSSCPAAHDHLDISM